MNPQKIALLTDSCVDLSPRMIEENHIFVVPLRILCQDGEYRDGVDIHGADIYARLRAGELPQTSLPAAEDVGQDFRRIVEGGYDGVIAVMLSSGLSGTYNLVRILAEECRGKLPVRVFDSLSGSLGQGISAAVGMALAGKLSNADYRVYTLLGDGEIQEGQVWEASMMAGFRKLDNLVVIVDNNNLQIDGSIDEVCSPYPIDKKFEAFNFHVINIDGNDFDQIDAAFKEARATKGMPTAIIAKTVKGKGVSFMENQVSWHGVAPNDEQYAVAMEELGKAGEALCQK